MHKHQISNLAMHIQNMIVKLHNCTYKKASFPWHKLLLHLHMLPQPKQKLVQQTHPMNPQKERRSRPFYQEIETR